MKKQKVWIVKSWADSIIETKAVDLGIVQVDIYTPAHYWLVDVEGRDNPRLAPAEEVFTTEAQAQIALNNTRADQLKWYTKQRDENAAKVKQLSAR